jgi:hypothetical protein
MKMFLLLFCLGIFLANARAEEQNVVEKATVQHQDKSIGEGAEHPAMTKEDREAMHADKHKMKKEMKRAMKQAREKEKRAIREAKEKHRAAAKKAAEPPPVPTEDQIKKADAEDDGSDADADAGADAGADQD